VDLYLSCEVIDLHVDTFIWTRIFGYDLRRRHGRGFLGGRYYGQADLPRLREAAVRGAVHVITTNPFRTAKGRGRALVANLERLTSLLSSSEVLLARTAEDYHRAQAAGKHAAFIGIQGANALATDEAREKASRIIVLATLVHLTPSRLAKPSVPYPFLRRTGLSREGKDMVAWLDAQRIFVDLAHIDRPGFFDAVRVHDRSLPLIVSHTGCAAVHPVWRNVDDEQLRAVAATGGVIGVMYAHSFLGNRPSTRQKTLLHRAGHADQPVDAEPVREGTSLASAQPDDASLLDDTPPSDNALSSDDIPLTDDHASPLDDGLARRMSPSFQGAERIVDHLEHIVKTVGEDFAALGSDFDGAIVTPSDVRTCLELPRIVQAMLDRNFSETSIRKILGQNFLRALRYLRGT